MKTLKSVQKQCAFCAELMSRLSSEITTAKTDYGRITYHSRMENDVIRLRRELNVLRDMLMQYGYGDEK